jgi:ribosomal protein S30
MLQDFLQDQIQKAEVRRQNPELQNREHQNSEPRLQGKHKHKGPISSPTQSGLLPVKKIV